MALYVGGRSVRFRTRWPDRPRYRVVAACRTRRTAYLYEYAGGLNGCNATQLATFPFFPGELVLDKNANLLLADQIDGVVDVIPPPYTAIGSQISVPSNPFSVTINRKNNRVLAVARTARPTLGAANRKPLQHCGALLSFHRVA